MALDDLGKKSVEGMQADYFIKEQQSVQKLHKLQTGLAEQLYAARLALQNKLNDEARKSGQGVEDYLSQYGLQQRLNSLAEETKARRAAFEGDEKALFEIKLQNQNRLKLADQTLAKLAKDNEKKLALLKQQSAEALKKLESDAAAEALTSALSGEEATTAAVTERLKLEAQERAKIAESNLEAELEAANIRANSASRGTFNAQQEAFNRLLTQANKLDGIRLMNANQTEEALNRRLVSEKLLLKDMTSEKELELEELKNSMQISKEKLAALEVGSDEYNALNESLKTQEARYAQINDELEDQVKLVQTLQDEINGTSMSAIGKWLEDAKKQEIAAKEEITTSMLDSLKKLGASYAATAAGAQGEEGIKQYEEQLRKQEALRLKQEEEIYKKSAEFSALGTEEKQKDALDKFRAQQKLESDARIDSEIAAAEKVSKHKLNLENANARVLAAREAAQKKKEKQDTLKRKDLADKRGEASKVLAEINPKTNQGGAKGLMANLVMSKTDKELAEAEVAQKFMEDGMTDEAEANRAAKSAVASARLEQATNALYDLVTRLAKDVEEIGQAALKVNTQMQGVNDSWGSGSYWKSLNSSIGHGIGMSPIVQQKKVVQAAQTLLDQGIVFNLEQRAFLEGIKEGIANTFNAADGTMLKLIRIQQADSTAARLGMESALTMFMNSMYATSEYMVEAAKGVREALYEAQALMESSDALSVEYQVQKWLGSLHSVGFSKSDDLAQAIGKYLSGNLEGLTEGGIGNLLLMATERAGLNVADILAKGLDPEGINNLLREIVAYLGDIYKETHGSNVLSQQYAQVFGVSASDLKAAANLSESMNKVSSTFMEEADFLGQLKMMVGGLYTRTGAVGLLDNLKANMSYMLSEGMGNNAISYLTNEVASLLEGFAGGINIPFVNAMGFGLDLNASVATLMKIAAMSGPILSVLGKTITGLGSLSPDGLLSSFGIDEGITRVKARGATVGRTLQKGASVSESGYIGNENSSDTKEKTMQDASAEGNSQIAEAKEEEDDVKLKQVDEHIIKIYELLDAVTTGSKSFYVAMAGGSTSGSAWTP